jgi:hypothetical protein
MWVFMAAVGGVCHRNALRRVFRQSHQYLPDVKLNLITAVQWEAPVDRELDRRRILGM